MVLNPEAEQQLASQREELREQREAEEALAPGPLYSYSASEASGFRA